MKVVIASLLFVTATSIAVAAPITLPLTTSLSKSLVSSATTLIPMPESKGRTGSKRVGGYNNKGKGSRYIGGRK